MGFATAAIVVRHFAEGGLPEDWRHMVEQAAREHGRREVAAFAVRLVDLLAEPDELLEIKLR